VKPSDPSFLLSAPEYIHRYFKNVPKVTYNQRRSIHIIKNTDDGIEKEDYLRRNTANYTSNI
jgi:hypothetical protein